MRRVRHAPTVRRCGRSCCCATWHARRRRKDGRRSGCLVREVVHSVLHLVDLLQWAWLMLHGVRCMLHGVRCMLHAARVNSRCVLRPMTDLLPFGGLQPCRRATARNATDRPSLALDRTRAEANHRPGVLNPGPGSNVAKPALDVSSVGRRVAAEMPIHLGAPDRSTSSCRGRTRRKPTTPPRRPVVSPAVRCGAVSVRCVGSTPCVAAMVRRVQRPRARLVLTCYSARVLARRHLEAPLVEARRH